MPAALDAHFNGLNLFIPLYARPRPKFTYAVSIRRLFKRRVARIEPISNDCSCGLGHEKSLSVLV